tara:strand:- start:1533 stop:1787 length:255 start_codon:yes stop_codon:yes gene_type:complete
LSHAPLAPHFDRDGVSSRQECTRARGNMTCVMVREDVNGKRRVSPTGDIQDALFDHRLCTARTFLAGLTNERYAPVQFVSMPIQ